MSSPPTGTTSPSLPSNRGRKPLQIPSHPKPLDEDPNSTDHDTDDETNQIREWVEHHLRTHDNYSFVRTYDTDDPIVPRNDEEHAEVVEDMIRSPRIMSILIERRREDLEREQAADEQRRRRLAAALLKSVHWDDGDNETDDDGSKGNTTAAAAPKPKARSKGKGKEKEMEKETRDEIEAAEPDGMAGVLPGLAKDDVLSGIKPRPNRRKARAGASKLYAEQKEEQTE